ncbi:hypothetical protein HWV62_29489 [Athelia sp. TMB]|nr:hypothetical protein HWV62_36523 [Athelia sp. TMB]KAF7982256.1 hypothetical protein HWV62_29489 [Athelia sp. TMB]
MAPLIKSKIKAKIPRKASSSRLLPRRASTPSQDIQRLHLKKQQLQQKKKQKKKSSGNEHHALAARRAKRERWAAIAADTQRIVLGDGKYVEERTGASGSQGSSSAASVYFSSANAPGPSETQQQGTVQVVHDIAPQIQLSRQMSTLYPHTSPSLASWRQRTDAALAVPTILTFSPSTTLTAARALHRAYPHLSFDPPNSLSTTKIGVLSFASAKRAGGGYLHGGDEQEEALARSTSLVASLDTHAGREFYATHKNFSGVDGKGIYDHSMVYSPGVVAFRKEDDDVLDDPQHAEPTVNESKAKGTRARSNSKPKSKSKGKAATAVSPLTSSIPLPATSSALQQTLQQTLIPPYLLNIISSTPPSYAAIHQNYDITPSTSYIFTSGIKSVLTQRLGRVLHVFEERGDRALVLGAYGFGSSEVPVEMIAEVWAELLVCGDAESQGVARFKDVFEHVVFALPGRLFSPFQQAFEMRVLEGTLDEATEGEDVPTIQTS